MPLSVVPDVEALTKRPVLTASIATSYKMLESLGLARVAADAGAPLSGSY
jgi:maleate isomerase